MSNIVKITLDLDTEIGRNTFISIGLAAGAGVKSAGAAPVAAQPEEGKQEGGKLEEAKKEVQPGTDGSPKKARTKKEKVNPDNITVNGAETVSPNADEESPVEEKAADAEKAARAAQSEISLDYLREQTAKKAVNNRPAIVEKLGLLGGAKNVASLSPEYYQEYSDYLDTLTA